MVWNLCPQNSVMKPLSIKWLYAEMGPLGSLSEVLCGVSQVCHEWQSYKKRGKSRVHSLCTWREEPLEPQKEGDLSKTENSPDQKPTLMASCSSPSCHLHYKKIDFLLFNPSNLCHKSQKTKMEEKTTKSPKKRKGWLLSLTLGVMVWILNVLQRLLVKQLVSSLRYYWDSMKPSDRALWEKEVRSLEAFTRRDFETLDLPCSAFFVSSLPGIWATSLHAAHRP